MVTPSPTTIPSERSRKIRTDFSESLVRVTEGFNESRFDRVPAEEEYFKTMLLWERKRAERSNSPFMLLLIDLSGLQFYPNAHYAVTLLASSVIAEIRETDLAGWYESGKTLGIIYTEFNKKNIKAVVDRIANILSVRLDPQQSACVNILHYIFPEDEIIGEGLDYNLSEALYQRNPDRYVSEKVCFICKRGIDIAVSLFGIIISLPLFIIVPIIIRLSSKGPAYFIQERVGRYGKKFKIIKFRTMKQENDCQIHQSYMKDFIKNSSKVAAEGKKVIFKMTSDPRVTTIGKILRKTSLDELPQLINVLLGTMSMVGPRPAIPYEVNEYDLWHKRRVFEVKPGLTGIWQVEGRSKTDFDNMVRMDIKYIKTWSPILDIMILIKTPFALLAAKGAY